MSFFESAPLTLRSLSETASRIWIVDFKTYGK